MRNLDDSLSGGGRDFIILAETTGMSKPAKSTLDYPSPRKFLSLMRLDFLRNIYAKTKGFIYIQYKSPTITSVGTELFDRRVAFKGKRRWLDTGFRVMYVRGVDDDRKQVSHDVYDDMPLSAFRFFLHQYRALRSQQPF